MSQNVLTMQSPIGELRITAGWDAPLQVLFCNVFDLDYEGEDDEDEEVPEYLLRNTYSNVDELVTILGKGGIELPQTMLKALREDVQMQTRNVIRVFKPDGTLEQEHQF